MWHHIGPPNAKIPFSRLLIHCKATCHSYHQHLLIPKIVQNDAAVCKWEESAECTPSKVCHVPLNSLLETLSYMGTHPSFLVLTFLQFHPCKTRENRSNLMSICIHWLKVLDSNSSHVKPQFMSHFYGDKFGTSRPEPLEREWECINPVDIN